MAEIKKVVIKVGDKKIDLTLDEVEELRTELNRLKGDTIYYPYSPPAPIWTGPYIWYTQDSTCDSITITSATSEG